MAVPGWTMMIAVFACDMRGDSAQAATIAAAATTVAWWSAVPERAGADARVHVRQHAVEHGGVLWLQEDGSERLHVLQRGTAKFPACILQPVVAHRVVLHAVLSTWRLFSWASGSARWAARWCACHRLACASSRPRRRRHAGASRQHRLRGLSGERFFFPLRVFLCFSFFFLFSVPLYFFFFNAVHVI